MYNNLDVVAELSYVSSDMLALSEICNAIQFSIQECLRKRPQTRRVSVRFPMSWRVATILFPGLSWRDHKKYHTGGFLEQIIVPVEGEDVIDQLVSLFRAKNGAFLSHFHSHHLVQDDNGTSYRQHNCTYVITNEPKHPFRISWYQRLLKQTLPDMKVAESQCGFFTVSFAISTGNEEETTEDCLPIGKDYFGDEEKECMLAKYESQVQGLEDDNVRLRNKTAMLMKILLDLGYRPCGGNKPWALKAKPGEWSGKKKAKKINAKINEKKTIKRCATSSEHASSGSGSKRSKRPG